MRKSSLSPNCKFLKGIQQDQENILNNCNIFMGLFVLLTNLVGSKRGLLRDLQKTSHLA